MAPQYILARSLCALSAALFVVLPTAQASTQQPVGPTLNLTQDLYEVGETCGATLTGTPGHMAWLLLDAHLGPATIAGIGTFDIECGDSLSLFPLGVIPPSGVLKQRYTPLATDSVVQQPYFIQAITVDPTQGARIGITECRTLIYAAGASTEKCPEPPTADPIYTIYPDGVSLWLPGVGEDFVFTGDSMFAEYGDGTARLVGEVERLSNPDERLLVDLFMADRVDAGNANYPPAGSPKKELSNAAYATSGGPIDTNQWHYYESLDGMLLGLDDLEGGSMAIGRFGPSPQVGFGANGVSLDYGASAWLKMTVLSQPALVTWNPFGHGDFNIDIRDCQPSGIRRCAVEGIAHPNHATFPGGVAFWLPGIAEDFIALPNMTFTEYANGTARLIGEIARPGNMDEHFSVNILFSDPVVVGDVNYPPQDSPKLELKGGAYVANGGPIDPSVWEYYETYVGTLIGLDDYDGGAICLERFGPAWQQGFGANNLNYMEGGAGWMTLTVKTTPVGLTWVPNGHSDINVDLIRCP
ncbi:MAG: hypothetical protein ACJAZ8_001904 [Planctomycetota bacterium]|jgi:hypothetical protein